MLLLLNIAVAKTNASYDISNCQFDKEVLLSSAKIPSNCVPSRDDELDSNVEYIISNLLGWQKSNNMCGGFYAEPYLSMLNTTLADDVVQISADQVSFYDDGKSTLLGNVVVEQPAKKMIANKAYIYRDGATDQITNVEAFGKVVLREPGRMLVGKQGDFQWNKNTGSLDNAIYRFSYSQAENKEGSIEKLDGLNAWGRASKIKLLDNGDYELTKATFATCPVENPAWHMDSSHITIDNDEGRAYAHNVFLNVGDIPIFYFPYLNFPVDNKRHSGLLMPIFGYSSDGGASFGIPYYWNMAPNYDMLITPRYYSKRGLLSKAKFRYLTDISEGELFGSYIPGDNSFANFIDDNQAQDPDLALASTDRYQINFLNSTQFNDYWSLDAQFQYVSDDYFLQDFGNSIDIMTDNQLLRQVDLTYTDNHWTFVSRLQSYQTLHPFNASTVSDVYSRYPQLLLNGYYADIADTPLLFQIDNEYVDYIWPGDDKDNHSSGNRFHTNPGLSLPLTRSWGYMTPKLQLQATDYDLTRNHDLGNNYSIVVPQYSIDSGLYFDKSIT